MIFHVIFNVVFVQTRIGIELKSNAFRTETQKVIKTEKPEIKWKTEIQPVKNVLNFHGLFTNKLSYSIGFFLYWKQMWNTWCKLS